MAQHRGGKGNFAEDPQRASEAGKKGGHVSGGNFRNDPARASAAGRKGGQRSHSNNSD
ncbi:general stress protein [Pseudomonas solani]|uniref:general stress protein n=1 Tax=Pseudomonas TaxID=286 RepID=UPI0009DBEA12|nr:MULTISPECIES: general stress protein [Pseudomonas]MDN4149376.1 general stress protein [Pseudomonas tohonis]MDU9416106.1 general stress protein [Pseudomonas sp. zfem005]WCD83161.1 general stress protein [Pseudomonas sp. TUM22785]